ncbi:MAG TPA: serine hydrolase domain-containing protein [candidate division Zixibacteria bacterium]|nr:serine hydrolase domain-containing protein [candidate division Zixibacteria bacterium]
MSFDSVEAAFQEAVEQGVFPGAVVLVGREDEVVYQQAFGFRSLVPERTPMRIHTIFDLASLTKPLATTLAVMLLVKERKVRLDDRVTRFFPTFGVFGKHTVSVRQLLSHTSGLAAWKPYYEEIVKAERAGRIHFVASRGAKSYVLEQIHRDRPVSVPGTQSLYSDLGFMVLGQLVEELTGATLDRFCQEQIFRPLELRSTSFVDLTQLRTRRLEPVVEMIAPTENCPWRKKILCGEVHDDNAYAMGGVAGHAGLFSSAQDIHRLVSRLSRCYRGEDNFLPAPLLREFLTRDGTVHDSSYALGWDTPSGTQSAAGSLFSPRSVGHLGFTGTSLWWDLDKNCHVILLSNRIHPTRKNERIRDFRPRIHDLIMKALFP